MDGEEPTQATQNVLDPRRVGKQNSGFSDEDISDIVCVLYPHSDSARHEVLRLAQDDSPHVIGKDEVGGVETDAYLEDHASRFESDLADHGNHAIILRLSAGLKNPSGGFAFGRNHARCDVVFVNDPVKRISNVHFRIFVNEHGNVMIEDQSTNGTFVDRVLLTANPRPGDTKAIRRWVLNSGSNIKVLLHQQTQDLTFRVRIPRREDEYERAYLAKVEDFFLRHGLLGQGNPAAPPAPATGPVDVFKQPAHPLTARRGADLEADVVTQPNLPHSPSRRKDRIKPLAREWNGSGKYNKIGTIGKGAFAVVYKVTSKYDGNPYAAKELEKRRFIKNGVLDQKVDNEMKIMKKVNHPHIVRYIENFDWEDRLLIIIMEFVPGGDLGKLIMDDMALPEDMAKVMSKQLLSALGYLHAQNITHRDVKPDNILINSMQPLDVKLTDFGLSKMVETEQTFLRTFCGTLLYCAPEVYTEYTEYDDNGFRNRHRVRRAPGQRYNHAVDIWSLGGVIFFTLTRSPPYPASSGISYSELLHKIMTTRLNIAPLQQYRVSDLGIDFLCRMLQRRPEHRATIAELDSHSWLGGPGSIIDASQSYDEITDDEDLMHTIKAQEWEGDDVISDSMGEDSEKENNDTFGQPNQTQRPRLFGEIGVSAVGSSGVLPEDFLPLPAVNGSGQETVIQNFEGEDAYNSGASSVFAEAQALSQIDGNAYVSALQNQSADQLQSLVLDVASQSLGGRSAEDGNVSMTKSLDFTASKRKPPSNSTSDEFDDGLSTKPTFKRLRSEANLEDLTSHLVEEYKLLACMPQINVLDSGRQIDNPVDKRSYWEQDRATWHLDYPEMTQLQHDAFSQAARDRGEEFWPAKTPLWELSMKYFPPTQDNRTVVDTDPPRIGLKRDDRKMGDETIDFPPTARPTDEEEDIPDTLPPDQRIVVPIQEDPSRSRAVGLLQSDVDSHIDDISLTITEPFMSFGRGPENTDMYKRRTESKVPKYAFKMLLIKDDYDPNKDSPKASYPWLTESEDPEAYHFWISTKATLGIKVNGHTIPSYDPKNPSGPSRHWARVHDGDELLIWGDVKNHTSLKFRCFWGASSKAREDVRLPPVMATEDWFQILDGTCLRAEKRYRESAERRRRVNEAVADLEERIRLVDRERQRSRAFEMKRVEAVKFLQARQIHVPRRGSTASAPPAAAYSSRLQSTTAGTTQASRLTPD